MSFSNKIPRLHLYALTALLLFLIVQTGLRVIFWLKFNNPTDPVTTHDLFWAFYLGMKFDLQASLGTLLPVLLLGWIKPLHPIYSSIGKRLWAIYISLAFAAMYLIYITDAGHYAYLQQRLNATALRFLENPFISATMVWETYPVVSGSFIFAFVLAVTIFIFLKLTNKIDSAESVRLYWKQKRWYKKTALIFITFIFAFSGLFAKISWYPLRWSDAFFSTHAFSSQLASNPVIYFSNTMKNVAETYDLDAAKQAYPEIVEYLGIQHPDNNKLNYAREYTFAASGKAKPNVIVVILESFASYKTSLSGNPLNPTPHIAQLANDGYYFKNFFTPSTGTARSIWTFTTGLPDIEKNKTSTRNPLIVNQHTVINAFKDYKKFYFLGGSASWANIRGLLSSNLPDLKLYEEGSYQSEVIDVWGISDLSLFREANDVLKNIEQPFFAVIQTSGNHRPYTIPDDNEGFELLTENDLPGDIKNYGFASLEEFNSFRFMDHSIGHFIERARKEIYFNNTLFVFFGDHGIHAATGNHIPAYEAQLNIQGLRVPLVFYGQNVIDKAKVFDTIASEVDVLPTIAAITKTDYRNTTLGRDLTDNTFAENRYAFTIEHGGGRTIGLLSDEYYLLMHPDGSKKRLHDLTAKNPRENVSAKNTETTQLLTKKLTALWNTIRYMRENNAQDSANYSNLKKGEPQL
ncbi:sulfatase family protein [hydrothermal vent metagenome]|uniref:Sulfatase family protein n=1 Tax=hydrothermal vent metagenome TaxID=652676 RepID=A0A3B0WDA5_9ZZZZ